jgi:hypothetical protein
MGERRDTASMRLRALLFGGGAFDVSGAHENAKGWDIYQLGQRSFWAVESAVAWDAPVREDPRYAEPIAAMLGFLCPGEKAAVGGAARISALARSEEMQFYFAEQALEEAKHFEAMRRLIEKLRGRALPPPGLWVRLLYSFGVIDPNDIAFMMGSINIIGEHLAHQILHRINRVATDPAVREVIALIGRDESRHIAAGQRFFPDVYPEFRRHRHGIAAKNLATTIVLLFAGAELVNPMRALGIDLAAVLEEMYRHYHDVVGALPAFPEQALLDALLGLLRRSTPGAVRAVAALTTADGAIDPTRLVAVCERALRSPRALRELFAA